LKAKAEDFETVALLSLREWWQSGHVQYYKIGVAVETSAFRNAVRVRKFLISPNSLPRYWPCNEKVLAGVRALSNDPKAAIFSYWLNNVYAGEKIC
jgi:hypothetical protein